MEITQIKTFNNKIDSFIDKLLPELEEVYKDIHHNPELFIPSPLLPVKISAFLAGIGTCRMFFGSSAEQIPKLIWKPGRITI